MAKPKEAVKALWNNGFFKEHRKTEEVTKICFSDFGCTCSNWSALLSTCKFLRKDKSKWVQKHNSPSNEDEFVYITGKTPWTDRNEKFINFVSRLKGEILIVDPYYGLDTLHILTKFPRSDIKFLTAQLGNDETEEIIKKEISRFQKEFKNIHIRVYPKFYELHDRYIISDNYFVVVGHGLKDFGNKECFFIAIPAGTMSELIKVLKERFEERWKNSKIII